MLNKQGCRSGLRYPGSIRKTGTRSGSGFDRHGKQNPGHTGRNKSKVDNSLLLHSINTERKSGSNLILKRFGWLTLWIIKRAEI